MSGDKHQTSLGRHHNIMFLHSFKPNSHLVSLALTARVSAIIFLLADYVFLKRHKMQRHL